MSFSIDWVFRETAPFTLLITGNAIVLYPAFGSLSLGSRSGSTCHSQHSHSNTINICGFQAVQGLGRLALRNLVKYKIATIVT